MIPELVVWAFMYLSQIEGMSGGAMGTKEQCEAARLEVMQQPHTMLIGPCVETKLEPQKQS